MSRHCTHILQSLPTTGPYGLDPAEVNTVHEFARRSTTWNGPMGSVPPAERLCPVRRVLGGFSAQSTIPLSGNPLRTENGGRPSADAVAP